MTALSDRLTQLREEKNWTKTYVAKKLGLKNLGTYANYEYGTRQPDNDLLAKIADLYGVTTDYLLGVNNTPAWASPKDVIDLKEYLDNPSVGDAFHFEGKPLSETQKEKLQIAITQIFWDQLKQQKGK